MWSRIKGEYDPVVLEEIAVNGGFSRRLFGAVIAPSQPHRGRNKDMLNLSKNQLRALAALPVTDSQRPDGVEVYTLGSLHRLVELGLAEQTRTKKGETQWVPTRLGKAAQKEIPVVQAET